MNPTNGSALVRYSSIKAYFASKECHENPKANIFSPSKTVRPLDAGFERFLIHDITAKIAGYLSLKDFLSFSSLNVRTYITLRSNNVLVGRVIRRAFDTWKLQELKDGLQSSCSVKNFDFAKILNFPGYNQFLERESRKKSPVSDINKEIIKKFIENPTAENLETTTFRHIIFFILTGQKSDRLAVACADYGYSMVELDAFRNEGKHPVDLARELLER